MTNKEAVETVVEYIKAYHGARENGKAIVCEALNTICQALELTKYHDKECLECAHLHCDTFCDHGECFEKRE